MSSSMVIDSAMGMSRKRGPSPSREESVQRDAPLSKRFRHLSLRGNHFRDRIVKSSTQRKSSPASSIRSKLQDAGSDFMQMDDSPDKVYVFDLDEEAKSASEDEEDGESESSMVFLPDIEKTLNKIPLSVLKSETNTTTPTSRQPSRDVILYRDPASIIAPQIEQESVRKMILRAREQARQKTASAEPLASQLPPTVVPQPIETPSYTYPPPINMPPSFQADPDAMEMD